MIIKLLKYIIFIIVSIFLTILNSCVGDEDYQIPSINCNEFETTISIEEFKENIKNEKLPLAINEENILNGYIVSSDESGNIFKQLFVVSESGKTGILININRLNSYNDFPVGRKIYINLKDISIANTKGMLELGDSINNKTVTRIEPYSFKKYFSLSCDKMNEEEIIQKVKIKDIIKDDSYLSSLIEIENIYFDNKGETFYRGTDFSTNNNITDPEGNKIIVVVNTFAGFKNEIIPSEMVKIRGILTKFGGNYQLLIRNITDIKIH